MAGLPTLVAFKAPTNGKYLRLVQPGYLSFSGDEASTPFSMFRLEKSTSQPDQANTYYNIKTLYNNRYWTSQRRTSDPDDTTLIVGATQPQEDSTQFPSTLFTVRSVKDDSKTVTIGHVRSSKLWAVAYDTTGGENKNFLYSKPEFAQSAEAQFKVINLDQIVRFPKYLAFKGSNGKFLRVITLHSFNHAQFFPTDVTDPSVSLEILRNPNGTNIWIKSLKFDKFLHSSPPNGYILASVDQKDIAEKTSWFTPTQVDDGSVTLFSVSKGLTCERYTAPSHYVVDSLCAIASSITDDAKMKFFDLATRREIYNCKFDVEGATVSSKEEVILATSDILVNNFTSGEIVQPVSLNSTIKHTVTWDSIVSYKEGVPTEISVDSATKLIIEGELELSVESQEAYQWGTTIETTESKTVRGIVKIPPNSKAVAKMVGTKASIRIPVVYSQRDTLVNGETDVSDNLEDGVLNYEGFFNLNLVYDKV